MAETIRDKVTKLDALRRELRETSTQAHDPAEYRLYPPPAPGEVRSFERRRGKNLPSSFRAFLELANAWRGFMPGWTLLGLRRRETELYFREGLDEKVIGALRDLVPDAELKALPTREKTDPKVLSPRDHLVVGVDGRGSVLVLDEARASAGEPEVALVKYIWVQRRWPSFGAFLDEAIGDAQKEVDARRAKLAPAAKPAKGARSKTKKPKAKAKAGASSSVPKLRVVEIRPSKAAKAAKSSKKTRKKTSKKTPAR